MIGQFEMAELYTVEKIIDKRIVQKGGIQVTQYRVKWLGYRDEDSTWEPYKNLKYVSDMIEQYEIFLKNAASQLSKNIDIRSPPITKKPLLFYEERKENTDQNNRMEQQNIDGANIYDRLNEIQLQKEDQEDDYNPRQQQPQTSKNHKKKGRSLKNNLDRTQTTMQNSKKGDERKSSQQQKEKQSNKKQTQHKKKRTQLDLNNKTVTPIIRKQAKQSYLSQIRQIEERICFNPKQKPYQFNPVKPSAPTGQVTILGLVRGRNNQFEFLTQQGELLSFRSRSSLIQHHPDELIRFFESKIDFQTIPKLSL